MNVKEQLYGRRSIEFVEAGLFFLDIVSILMDKSIEGTHKEGVIAGTMKKFEEALEICSADNRTIMKNYISRYCES